ncbi:MAG: AAA family ATPase [Myxococcota bacterium]
MLADFSDAVENLFREAEDIANQTGQQLTSAHILLAAYTFENNLRTILLNRKISEDTILAVIQSRPEEKPEIIPQIKQKAIQTSKGLKNNVVDTLAILWAILNIKESLAYKLLEKTQSDFHGLRMYVSQFVSSGMKSPVVETRTVRIEIPKIPNVNDTNSNHRSDGNTATTTEKEEVASIQKDNSGRTDLCKFELSKEEFPILNRLGRNITLEAALGNIDPVIGREKELSEIIDILGKRRTNNPLLVGEPGVGKTAIVEGLADIIVNQPHLVPALENKVIIELNMTSIMAGTQLRGALTEKLNGIKEEVKKAKGRVIVFFDEIHQLLGNSSQDLSEDTANSLKTELARGDFPCIGATTNEEFTKFFESDPAFKRRFQAVLVREPSVDETVKILKGIVPQYSAFHKVSYTDSAIDAASKLSSRYITDKYLPDKAISVIDLAGSKARREGKETVTEIEIAQVLSKLTGIPVEKLLLTDTERLLKMEEILSEKIISHREVISRIARVLRRNYAGISSRRPIGSFLFIGPTGVGKTEMAKVLADFLFQSGDALIRIDMSEYAEAHSIARLIGSPPGYVGFESGGVLTEAVRKKPYSVVLLDEAEKAHQDVLELFLQVLDDGILSDGRGRRVDFTNTIIIITTNAGANLFYKRNFTKTIGFGGSSSQREVTDDEIFDALRDYFPIELLNRIDEKCVFYPLSREDIKNIAFLILKEMAESLRRERRIGVSFDSSAIEYVLNNDGYNSELGARPLRQAINRLIIAPIAESILRGEISSDSHIVVKANSSGIVFEKG